MQIPLEQRPWIILCLWMVCLCPSLSLANEPNGQSITRLTPNGYINWSTGTVTATGIGIPPRNAPSAVQASEMARTAAWSVALANLLEVVNGIRVDAQTTVRNYVTTNAEVQTHVEGMIKQAIVIEERELPTGEVKTTVQMQAAGELTEQLASPRPTPASTQLNRLEATQDGTKKPQKKISPPTQTLKPATTFTGLLVDARSIGAQQCLAPRIVADDNEIYGPAIVDKQFISGPSIPKEDQKRIAWYFTDETKARSHKKISPNPFVVKATRAIGVGKTDLIIDEISAQRLQSQPEYLDLLKQAKVLILIDSE